MTGSSAIAAHTVTKARLMRPTLSMGPYGATVPWRGRASLAPIGRDCAQGLLASWGPAGDDLVTGGAGGPPSGAGRPSYEVRGPPGATAPCFVCPESGRFSLAP